MKKLLATMLAVTTVLSSASMTALADGNSAQLNNSNTQTSITATYTSVGNNPWGDTRWDDETTRVAVSVKWTDPSFKYEFGTEWIPSEKKYEEAPGWIKNSFQITVENHSNCPIATRLSCSILKRMGVGMSYSYGITSAKLTSAVNPADIDAGNNKVVFVPIASGTPTKFLNAKEDFACFTVSIGANDPIIKPEPTEPETPPVEPETPEPDPDEGHKHHFVYDQFGRLVCTGCNEITHTYCTDLDGDDLCDECGLDTYFCPDCHKSRCDCDA